MDTERPGDDPLADPDLICEAASSLAGNLFVCIALPGHRGEANGVGHRFVHDYRTMPVGQTR